MTKMPAKLDELIKKNGKKKLQYVLFRLPYDMKVSELDGVKLDLADLKITSLSENLKAVPDMHTDPDRASACILLPDSEGKGFKCGSAFAANVQIIRERGKKVNKPKDGAVEEAQKPIKKEETKKIRKIKSEN
jgi:hypothetical protein